jgi:hypothetical protein
MGVRYSPAIVTSGLVLSLDAANRKSYPGTGTTWSNLSGNNINFTTFNSPTFNNNNCGYFTWNGSSTYATAPESSLFNTETFTIECWARTSNLNQNGFLFEKGNVNTQYALFFEQNNNLKLRTNTVTSGIADLSINTSTYLTSNVWFLVTASYNYGIKRIYFNGSYVSTQTVSGGFTTNANGMSIGVYGGYNGSRGYYYSGDISNLKFYNRVLTDDEILQNYRATKNRFGL